MGKYFIKITEGEKDYPLTTKIIVLNSLANELAEANRLKRWEIKLTHKEIKDTTVEKDLEDQA